MRRRQKANGDRRKVIFKDRNYDCDSSDDSSTLIADLDEAREKLRDAFADLVGLEVPLVLNADRRERPLPLLITFICIVYSPLSLSQKKKAAAFIASTASMYEGTRTNNSTIVLDDSSLGRNCRKST